MQYVLASASPRRRELFKLVRPDFRVMIPEVNEIVPPDRINAAAAEFLAELKGAAAAEQFKTGEAVVVSADTIVCIDGRILGKPHDEDEARKMLSRLSGRTHTVYTGVALVSNGWHRVFSEATDVEFYPLSDAMIREYIATGEPFDKAGAYGIQGRGGLLVRGVSGDYFNVVGLPVARLLRELSAFENELPGKERQVNFNF